MDCFVVFFGWVLVDGVVCVDVFLFGLVGGFCFFLFV